MTTINWDDYKNVLILELNEPNADDESVGLVLYEGENRGGNFFGTVIESIKSIDSGETYWEKGYHSYYWDVNYWKECLDLTPIKNEHGEMCILRNGDRIKHNCSEMDIVTVQNISEWSLVKRKKILKYYTKQTGETKMQNEENSKIAKGNHEGHFGCPECGCREFRTHEGYVEYGSQEVYCSYAEDIDEDHGDYFGIDDYGDCEGHDRESLDIDDRRECIDCSYDYETPAFYPKLSPMEKLAENNNLEVEEVEYLGPHLKKFCACNYIIKEKTNVINIVAEPVEKEISKPFEGKYTLQKCCECSGDMSVSFDKRTRLTTNTKKHIPVILEYKVCRKCNK